jgi:hypothetical protein
VVVQKVASLEEEATPVVAAAVAVVEVAEKG